MQILDLTLYTANLAAQHDFFVHLWGVPIVSFQPQRQLTLKISETRLTWQQRPAWASHYHYALNIPPHQFEAARDWLSTRTPLLPNAHQETHFHFESWNADAVYFEDADGNIGELIARHGQPHPTDSPFSGHSLRSVSELGLVTDTVQATAAHLCAQFGLAPYHCTPNDSFMSIGDVRGLFILVPPSRGWMPSGKPAAPADFFIRLQTDHGIFTFENR